MSDSAAPVVDFLEIDLVAGQHWLALDKQLKRDAIRQRTYAKHRTRHLLDQSRDLGLLQRTPVADAKGRRV